MHAFYLSAFTESGCTEALSNNTTLTRFTLKSFSLQQVRYARCTWINSGSCEAGLHEGPLEKWANESKRNTTLFKVLSWLTELHSGKQFLENMGTTPTTPFQEFVHRHELVLLTKTKSIYLGLQARGRSLYSSNVSIYTFDLILVRFVSEWDHHSKTNSRCYIYLFFAVYKTTLMFQVFSELR